MSQRNLCLRVSTPGGSDVAPAPLRGGVTDWGYEEVRGCADVPVGRLGVWWQFRYRHASDDGCPCSNSGADHDCCADDHGRRDEYCGVDHHSRPDYHDCIDNHCDAHHHRGTNHHNYYPCSSYNFSSFIADWRTQPVRQRKCRAPRLCHPSRRARKVRTTGSRGLPALRRGGCSVRTVHGTVRIWFPWWWQSSSRQRFMCP